MGKKKTQWPLSMATKAKYQSLAVSEGKLFMICLFPLHQTPLAKCSKVGPRLEECRNGNFHGKIMIWVCLKIGYIPNYSHLIGIMIINHWALGYTIFRHTHIPSEVGAFNFRDIPKSSQIPVETFAFPWRYPCCAQLKLLRSHFSHRSKGCTCGLRTSIPGTQAIENFQSVCKLVKKQF